jgi:diguanylate cyclase (GGDEF)-like protein
MKRICGILAIGLGCVTASWGAIPSELTSLSSIHALSNADAARTVPVAFEATVTYYRGYENLLFVQDDGVAIFVRPYGSLDLIPGDRILVKGTTQESFRPIVLGKSITLLHHGAVPRPVSAGFEELIRAERDCRFVTVHGVVRAADLVLSSAAPIQNVRLQLVTDGGHFEADVDSQDESALEDLLGAEVEVTGAESGEFDNKMEQTGVRIHVSRLADIAILKRAAASAWSLPVTPMDQVFGTSHVQDLSQRVHVSGTITYYEPGSALVLQEGDRSLWISTLSRVPLQIGDRADVTGFPDAHNFSLSLTDGEVKDQHMQAPVIPLTTTWKELAYWDVNKPNGHQFDLVSVEGKVVAEVQEAARDEYVLTSGAQLFTAVFRHSSATGPQPAMMRVPEGSIVRVTGICMTVDSNNSNKGHDVPFELLMRSFDDISLVTKSSWLNIRNLIAVVGLLLVVLVGVSTNRWSLSRKLHRQTALLAKRLEAEAAMERRRSRILEDINGLCPLAQIIEEITELVSSSLNGAPTWCKIADGARLGAYPRDAEALRIVQKEIPGRSGPSLGVLSAQLDPQMPGTNDEIAALSLGAWLATLAIETRRLYTDLRHRSEFDLLTDIHNRFSLETRLDEAIGEARQKGSSFGLIYIDLDGFKQVNDTHGHRIGDLYLREAALRMKRQLRSSDTLARVGGDEFAALIVEVHERAEVEEIAQRLVQAFNDPFDVERCILRGSASAGTAMYPYDGTGRDALIKTADAAMYAAKHNCKRLPETARVARESN